MTLMESIGNKGSRASKRFGRVNLSTAFWANCRMNLRRLKKTLIVMCVLHALGLPLLMVSSICVSTSNSLAMAGFIPLGGLCLSVALMMGFIIALNSFDYLYKKTKVDMVYALPLTTRQRFLSDYLSGLLGYTVPYVVSVVVTLIVHGLACFGISEWADISRDDGITSYLLKFSVYGLLVMVMFYTLTVLVTSCCGSMFEAIAYNVVANGLIPGTIATFFLVFFGDLYGIDVEDYLLGYISSSSPIGAIIGVFELYDGILSQWVRSCVILLVVDVLYLFVAYLLYSRRKAEDVSKPFVFKAFYYVVMSAITFIIVSMVVEIDDSDYVAPLLFLSAIVYFICEVITNRGFKRFGWSVLRYIGTVCGVVVLCLVLKGTNGFGIEDWVPKASAVRSVEVDYDGLYGDSRSYYSDSDTVTYTDRDCIQDVIDFHQDAVQNHFDSYVDESYYKYQYDSDTYSYTENTDDYAYNDYYQSVSITYHTKLGKKVSRRYYVSFEQYLMLVDLSVDGAYVEDAAESFKNRLISSYAYDYDSYYYTNDNTIPVEDREYYISVNSKVRLNSTTYNGLTYSQILELADCYRKDLEARTLDDILTPDTYCYVDGYMVFSSYQNTVQFLTKNGYKPPTVSDELDSYYGSYNTTFDYSSDFVLYAPDDITCVGGDYYTTVGAYVATNGKSVYFYSDAIKLLEVAQPNYVTTDSCYVLKLNNDLYVVPSEYSQVAEDVYRGYDESDYSDYDYSQSALNSLDGCDYLSCYLDCHDAWNEYFSEDYPYYEDFVDGLLYGSVDLQPIYDSDDYYDVYQYYGYYWTVSDEASFKNFYYDYGLYEDYPDYGDFVWYALKYNFSQLPEGELFDDGDTESATSSDSDGKDASDGEDGDDASQDGSKIVDKPIDESLSSL